MAMYDIVIAESTSPRDGRFIEKIGSYNPNTDPSTVVLKSERAVYWLMVGATPTDTARSVLSHEGIMYRKHLQVGVNKGAITQEQADEKYTTWNDDTVIGKSHDGVLLTLVERRTKYVLMVKLRSKHARALALAAVKALGRSNLPVKTITFDNGLEFACHEHIGNQLGAATYFAHPYHSWDPPVRERGLNENTNAGPPGRLDPAVHSQGLPN